MELCCFPFQLFHFCILEFNEKIAQISSTGGFDDFIVPTARNKSATKEKD